MLINCREGSETVTKTGEIILNSSDFDSSSTEPPEEDESPEAKAERERVRRQANNARERCVFTAEWSCSLI